MSIFDTIAPSALHDLTVRYAATGRAELPSVSFPLCDPECRAVHFVGTPAPSRCAVYIPSTGAYLGADEFWLDVFFEESAPGWLLVFEWEGGLVGALHELDAVMAILAEEARMTRHADRSGNGRNQQVLTDIAAVEAALDRPPEAVITAAELEERLKQDVRGQDAALGNVAAAVANHVARVQPRRPLSMLFWGATGIGKTKVAEALYDALADFEGVRGEKAWEYLRVDLSEFSEKQRVSSLLGAPPGYVGHGDGALLPDTLRAHSRTIVLFDEVEKAHPDILKTVMNMLDAGRLTNHGARSGARVVDCRRAILIFTTNLGAENAVNADADDSANDDGGRAVLLKAGVAHELVGRLSRCVFFGPLDTKALAEIVALAVERVGREYGLMVERVAPEVVVEIIQGTRTTTLGARLYEYTTDRLLGPIFAATRAEKSAVEVLSNPLRCVPANARRDRW